MWEVEIFAVDLYFASLEIERLAAQRCLGRLERRSIIAIDDQAIGILMAEIELPDGRIITLAQAIRRICWKPAPRLDVELGPVVHVPADTLGLPSALPACGDAGAAAHGDEEHRLNAAIAPPAFQRLGRKAWDGAI